MLFSVLLLHTPSRAGATLLNWRCLLGRVVLPVAARKVIVRARGLVAITVPYGTGIELDACARQSVYCRLIREKGPYAVHGCRGAYC